MFSKAINDWEIINRWERVALRPLSTTGRLAGGCLPTIPVWLGVTAVRLRQFGDFSNFSFRSVRFSLDSEWKALTWISVHEDLWFSPVYHHKQTACNNQFTHSVDPIQSQTEKLNPSYWHFIALTNLLCRQQQTCSPSTKQLLQTMTLTMLRSQTIVSPPWLRH